MEFNFPVFILVSKLSNSKHFTMETPDYSESTANELPHPENGVQVHLRHSLGEGSPEEISGGEFS